MYPLNCWELSMRQSAAKTRKSKVQRLSKTETKEKDLSGEVSRVESK